MYFENNDNNENIERIPIYIMIYFSMSTFDTTSISKFIRNNYYKKKGTRLQGRIYLSFVDQAMRIPFLEFILCCYLFDITPTFNKKLSLLLFLCTNLIIIIFQQEKPNYRKICDDRFFF